MSAEGARNKMFNSSFVPSLSNGSSPSKRVLASTAPDALASSTSGFPLIPWTHEAPRSTAQLSDRSVLIRPPMRLRASKTTTENPSFLRLTAAARPAIPAPIITTVLSGWILRAPSTNPDPPKKYVRATVFRNVRRFIMLPWIPTPRRFERSQAECTRRTEVRFCVARTHFEKGPRD